MHVMSPDYYYQLRQTHLADAEARVRARGMEPGQLQWKWREYGDKTPRGHYDSQEVMEAICDALNREGIVAWIGDGVSCVEQMVRAQFERAERAERELAKLKAGQP